MYGYGYGYDSCYDPCGGYGGYGGYGGAGGGCGGASGGKGFALIVVLFILLIIVGASQFGERNGKGAVSPASNGGHDCKCS